MEMRLKIFRFDPSQDAEPYYREYVVSARPEDRILDLLNRLRWEQDGTLGYRMSCAHGVCGSCAMKINGQCGLACQKLAGEYGEGSVTLEPLPGFKILKDLLVDFDLFFQRVQEIRPYLMAQNEEPEKERHQSPEQQKKIDGVIRCILCGCCTGACPVTVENAEYIGPATIVQAFRRIYDSRDDETGSRLEQMNNPNGVWPCVNHFECTRACPKEILVTKSINTIKGEIKKTIGVTQE